ncbi:Ig-like domain-containing protein [Christiangramia echinicola]|nr:Ig-like domain-containing protein [Christiangramia echinicola]
MKAVTFIFFLFYFSGNVFGQHVTITSPQSPGPTSTSPIEVLLTFEDAVNNSISGKLNLNNASINSEERLIPGFEHFASENFPTVPITANIGDYFGQGFPPINEYVQGKLKNVIVAFDVNSNNDIIYLTYGNGVFRYRPGQSDVKLINDEFESPIDLAIDNEDRIVVADAEAYAVKVYYSDYNGSNNLLYTIGGAQGKDGNEFYGPTGLAITNDNLLYVADAFTGSDPMGLDQVKIYKLEATNAPFQRRYGNDQLDDPFRIAVDNHGVVYVSDSGGNNGRIQIFSATDEYVNTIGNQSNRSPASLIVDEFGYIYSVDYQGDINFSDIFQDPESFLNKYDEIKQNDYPVIVYNKVDQNYDTSEIEQLQNNLNLPVDVSLNTCQNILVLDLELGGYADLDALDVDASLDFDVEKFKRNDQFKLLIDPNIQGEVKLGLQDTDFFICDPQPEGEFSIVYETEDSNNAPTAVSDAYTVLENETLTEPAPGILNNDTDPDDDTLTAILQTDVSNGTLTLNSNGSFTYTPDPDYTGPDSFTYLANDGELNSNIVTVSITVNPEPNQAPTAVADSYTVLENETLTESAPGILNNDTDPDDDTLTAVLQTDVSNGTLTLNSNGSFTYTPDPDYTGTDSFTYLANDGELNSNEVSVSITVESDTSQPPEAKCIPIEIFLDTEGNAETTAEIISNGNDDMILELDRTLFTCDDLGENTVTLTVTDPETGLSDSCSTTVVVLDQIAPTFENCSNRNLSITIAEGSFWNLQDFRDDFTATDNCDGDLEYTQDPEPGTPINETTDVAVRVTDGSGNTKSCLFTIDVTIVQGNDLIINCPGDVTIFADENCEYRVPDLSEAIDVSNEEAIIEQSLEINSIFDNNVDPYVRVTATFEGESVFCDIYLTPKDEVDPVIECPADETINLGDGESYTLPDYTAITEATDNCGEVTITQQPTAGTEITEDVEVVVTARDSAGNTTSCDFQVNIVREGEISISCPEDITAAWDENCEFVLPDYTAQAGINSNGEFEIMQTPAPGTIITAAETEVTISASDNNSNDSCNFILSLEDNTPPALNLKNTSAAIGSDGIALISFADIDNGSFDNCDAEVNYVLSKLTYTCKNLGENLVQVSAEDSNGNISTGTAVVTITDEQGFCDDPVIGSEYIFIYPNPNIGSFKIATPADVVIERVEVFDHRGRFIAAKDFESTVTEYSMNLGPLQEAVYVLKIVTNEKTFTKRFIFKY